MGHRPPAPITRHIDQIVGDNISDIDFGFVGGPYRGREADVLHILDPESLLPETTSEERLNAAVAITAQLKEQNTALVQTVFNYESRAADPSGSLAEGRTADPAQEVIDKATSTFVVLDEVTPTPDPERTALIPHGHFREKFLGYPRGEQVPGRLLCISRSHLGRSAEGPLKVFSVVDTPGLALRIVGSLSTRLQGILERSSTRSPGAISSRTESLSDAELIREIDAAEIVILPEIENLTDATMLFMVLSLNRPVLVPDSERMRLLADEVGHHWILRHSGPLTAELIDQFVEQHRSEENAEGPRMDSRNTETILQKYAEVYHRATVSVSCG